MNDSVTFTVTPSDPDRLWKKAERQTRCTCGLTGVLGMSNSAWISHATKCAVRLTYERLVKEER
jgi:hypothetical protein